MLHRRGSTSLCVYTAGESRFRVQITWRVLCGSRCTQRVNNHYMLRIIRAGKRQPTVWKRPISMVVKPKHLTCMHPRKAHMRAREAQFRAIISANKLVLDTESTLFPPLRLLFLRANMYCVCMEYGVFCFFLDFQGAIWAEARPKYACVAHERPWGRRKDRWLIIWRKCWTWPHAYSPCPSIHTRC